MSTPKLESTLDYPLAATRPAADDSSSAASAAGSRVLLLFDECAPGLRRYIQSFGLNAAATDDLLQEVFLALFRHLRLGRPATNLKGWVFQVAHNLALKQRQRAWKRQRIEAAWDPVLVEQVLNPALNPEESFADEERRRRLLAVLRRMPERDQRCIALRAEGLCYRDIGKTLGISLGSVAKSLVRAISKLAAADQEYRE